VTYRRQVDQFGQLDPAIRHVIRPAILTP
jgi:hypothetical protein